MKAKFYGEFWTSEKNGKFVGMLYRVAEGFVIRGIEEFSGRTLWESAPLPGSQIKRFRTLNLGYQTANYYTAK